MRVRLGAIDVSERARRALAAHFGRPGLASRSDICAWADSLIGAAFEDLCADLDRQEEDDADTD